MLSFFKKKHWYYFYLPVDIINKLSLISTDELNLFFHAEKINFVKTRIIKVTDNLDYIGVSFMTEKDLEVFKKYLLDFKELLPPWLVFPDLFQGTPRWNQGVQEDYCVFNWLPYWKSLNKKKKEKYLEKYECPSDWKSWLIENYF